METCGQIIQQGLYELDIPSKDTQLDVLLCFIKLIEKWNKIYNLTAIKKPEEMARLHILDSLTVLPYIKGQRVADIGTGAGFPGVPLAIFLPEVDFTLIDSNSKKTRFVQQAILELKLNNVMVIHSRIENAQITPVFSTVIMRAFSNLQTIIRLTRHVMDAQSVLLAMKGQYPYAELASLTVPHSVIPIRIPSMKAERCLIQIKGIANNG